MIIIISTLLIRVTRAVYICLLLLELAGLTRARPAQAVMSHQPISKLWWGPRQATGTTIGAVTTGRLNDCKCAPPCSSTKAWAAAESHRRLEYSMTASEHHLAAQPKPLAGWQRLGCSMTASACHPVTQPRPELRLDGEDGGGSMTVKQMTIPNASLCSIVVTPSF